MGLDISYYKKITPMDAVFDEDGEPIDAQTREPLECDYYQPIQNPDYDRADGITRGIYSFEESDGFRAGSYSGYGHWRNQLAELAGYPAADRENHHKHSATAWEAESGPFWEMITFSDCEGTIGAKTSAKLAKDFADHQAKADAHEDELFRGLYAEWRKAFEMAAEEGAVSFH